MSLCPHHLLRSRLSAGLPSRAPQHRTRLGHWYRQRTNLEGTRHVTNHAFNSNTAVSGDIRVVNNDVKTSTVPRSDRSTHKEPSPDNSSASSTAASNSFLKQSNTAGKSRNGAPPTQQPDTSVQPPREGRGRRATRLISQNSVRRIVHNGGFRRNLAHHVISRLNSQIKHQKRFVKPRSVHLEALIRLGSLYSRLLAINQWKAAYAEIFKAKHYDRSVYNRAVIPTLKDFGLELLEKVQQDCLGSFRETWDSLDRTVKAAHWMRLVLWLLQNSPELALEFLFVTVKSKDCPNFTMVADCLLYLDAFYYDSLKKWRKDTHTYHSVLQACLDPRSWPILSLPQKGVRLYLRRSNHEGVSYAFRLVRERQIEMTAETALCFMHRFTDFGDVDSAVEALQYIPKLKQPGFGLDSEGVSRHCSKLLTLDSVVGGGPGGRNFRILPRLLEMGVRPDRDMMNVVLSNAFKTGDPQLGLDMLNFMKAQGQELDSYSYIALLSDAVARGDRERVNALIQEIEPHEELRTNPYIASKLFHAYYVFTAKHLDVDANPKEVFYSMLDKYNQLHDITPLKELSIVPLHYTPPLGSANTPPSLVALYIMIATYFRCQKRISNAQRIYTRFRNLAAQGHEIIAPLAATDHTYNEFLIALRDDPRGLRWCVRLVEDMLQSDSLNLGSDPEDKNTAIVHSKPTVRTWTILLSAFVFNKQPLAAEKVKEMMAKHGVKFNNVTWNIVISGYANAQDVPEVAKSMKTMEEQGFVLDEYTMKSLRYLRDPERLWVAVEELDKAAAEAGLPSRNSPHNESAEKDDANNRERLLDQGLRRLEAKLNPKL
ncbi:hypothetical protein ASPWEDRAFT_48832 [Aspergillus wentii DTO 134E9]|uniref:Pentacotripeptide-repeat region of PRORP domain-containing protein n=1 Tax=Aspergillus wentii DTO 134E9 TaxID=1073089 RepID=A0A1L9RUR3_ASPWE|nr:uncharacterized protein ASPWEDRAFT_48832 [Aspergillus wentii DTO 134E9]KAI9928558.1 hypothetical protein MW887_001772 [Aspergillus wentii]OJJ38633.1 hypothetical protein ASPWEDRAFT_48832 [Aspergillus wentii DTO 134E9]